MESGVRKIICDYELPITSSLLVVKLNWLVIFTKAITKLHCPKEQCSAVALFFGSFCCVDI